MIHRREILRLLGLAPLGAALPAAAPTVRVIGSLDIQATGVVFMSASGIATFTGAMLARSRLAATAKRLALTFARRDTPARLPHAGVAR